jgi:hypothetical protein
MDIKHPRFPWRSLIICCLLVIIFWVIIFFLTKGHTTYNVDGNFLNQ